MPPLGVFSLVYSEAVSELLREVRVFLWHRQPDDRRERLELWRKELASELEARRRDHERLENLPSG
jgi:hypothetical protein